MKKIYLVLSCLGVLILSGCGCIKQTQIVEKVGTCKSSGYCSVMFEDKTTSIEYLPIEWSKVETVVCGNVPRQPQY